jgi:hypothetical protein
MNPIKRFFSGSVSTYVVEQASSNVVVVKLEEEAKLEEKSTPDEKNKLVSQLPNILKKLEDETEQLAKPIIKEEKKEDKEEKASKEEEFTHIGIGALKISKQQIEERQHIFD